MSERILYPEWRDQNRDTKYPFSDSAKMRNRHGVVIPNNLFVDAIIHPIGGRERMYLSKVIIQYDRAILFIGDVGARERCFGIIPFSGNLSDKVELQDQFGRPAGLLLGSDSSNLLNLASWGQGSHEFDIEDSEFCANVCVPLPVNGGIRGFILEDGTYVSGDVWFVGENGVILDYVTVERRDFTAEDNQTETLDGIVINVVGDPLFKRKFCDNVFQTPRFIKRIKVIGPNGQIILTPDPQGNINFYTSNRLSSDSPLRLIGTENGIIVGVVSPYHGPQ